MWILASQNIGKSERPLVLSLFRKLLLIRREILVVAFVRDYTSGFKEIGKSGVMDAAVNEKGYSTEFVSHDYKFTDIFVIRVKPFAIVLALDAKRSNVVAKLQKISHFGGSATRNSLRGWGLSIAAVLVFWLFQMKVSLVTVSRIRPKYLIKAFADNDLQSIPR